MQLQLPMGLLRLVRQWWCLMTNAYELRRFQIVGGPDWLDTARFDIQATAPDSPNLRPDACPSWIQWGGGISLSFSRSSLQRSAGLAILQEKSGRLVIDRTGLPETHDLDLRWGSAAGGISIFTALWAWAPPPDAFLPQYQRQLDRLLRRRGTWRRRRDRDPSRRLRSTDRPLPANPGAETGGDAFP